MEKDFSVLGENIAYGAMESGNEYMLRHYVDDTFKNRGHRKNMINAEFTHTGIAYCDHKTYDKILVVVFGKAVNRRVGESLREVEPFINKEEFDAIFSIESERIDKGKTHWKHRGKRNRGKKGTVKRNRYDQSPPPYRPAKPVYTDTAAV